MKNSRERNLAGERFGHLLVLSLEAGRGLSGLWRTQCDCGKLRIVQGYCLTKRVGAVRSCGCLSLPRGRPKGSRNKPKVAERKPDASNVLNTLPSPVTLTELAHMAEHYQIDGPMSGVIGFAAELQLRAGVAMAALMRNGRRPS